MAPLLLDDTAAARAARVNHQANLRALSQAQPSLVETLAAHAPEGEWLFARDGSLTLRSPGAGWASGCSLPRRAAQSLLEKMELSAGVCCFLAPTHAALLRVTCDRLPPHRALIAIVPDAADLAVFLACDDFSVDIESHRLAFAAGHDWPQMLERLLTEHDGLAVPGQFVRTNLVDADQIDPMIATAQGVFSREAARRADLVRALFDQTPITPGRVCVVAPRSFRLWENPGPALADLAASQRWHSINPDQPTHGSPVAFARAAAGRDALLLANVGRADLPPALPRATKVITWLTVPLVPRFTPDAAGDRLLVVDPRWRTAAQSAGWPADRVTVAGWPRSSRAVPVATARGLAVIADTLPLATPPFALSSQKVLWDTIAAEIARDPTRLGPDVSAYLSRWIKTAGIAEEAVDHAAFIERLIVPAYQQSLVRQLLAGGVDLTLHGRGWSTIDEFAPRAAGEVTDDIALARALESCAVLVHVWPWDWPHPIESAGRPVLRRSDKTAQRYLTEARRLAAAPPSAPAPAGPELSAALVRSIASLR